MTRQSISFTAPNDAWLKAQIDSEEYSSKSEIVNDLIRKARREQEEMDFIRAKMIAAENSGFVDNPDPQAILQQAKDQLRDNGEL